MNVSIVTVTQPSRRTFFNLLAEEILPKQTYHDHILEWIIIYHSDQPFQVEELEHIKQVSQIENVYVYNMAASNPLNTIGKLRNEYNKYVKGEFVVCFDDDDFYPVTRIEHLVTLLEHNYPNQLVIGCHDHFVYDHQFGRFYQFCVENPNYIINSMMAYHADYIHNHNYNNEDKNAEEKYFLENYTIPVIYSDPYHSGVQLSHGGNTVQKRFHILHPQVVRDVTSVIPNSFKQLILNNEKYLSAMEETYQLQFYSSPLLSPPVPLYYDIVWYCGYQLIWNPKDTTLGGSEQAIRYLSYELANKHHLKIACFGAFQEPILGFEGVDYYPTHYFPFRRTSEATIHIKHLIIWRTTGMESFTRLNWFHFPLVEGKIIWDLHDSMVNINNTNSSQLFWQNNFAKFHIMTKSSFHAEIIKQQIQTDLKMNIFSIENGVRHDLFVKGGEGGNITRYPFRLCYTSCYTRGLIPILQYIWPHLLSFNPLYELHLYYGTDLLNVYNSKVSEEIHKIISKTRNVCDHGRVSQEVVAYEKKYLSVAHIYLTQTLAETDCISVKESLIAGCIPLFLDMNVFKERVGVMFSLYESGEGSESGNEVINKESGYVYAERIHQLLTKGLEQTQTGLAKFTNKIPSWEDISNEWITQLEL